MSSITPLFSFNLLEAFKESHPNLNTVEQILSFSEERFIDTYNADFNGDSRKARQVYRQAEQVRERAVLLWANIKDTVAASSIQQGLFNNIPESFIRHQQSIPGYHRLFGNLDYLDCEACRSIFGPAAYFVDLLRFIETHIPQDLDSGHTLAERQPRLFQIPLDSDNTYNLIPYIDIVNEILEDILRNNQTSPYEILEASSFPMTLPFHLPLAEIRLYLQQLKLDLQSIYTLFGVVEPEIAREILSLSPREYSTLESQITDKTSLDKFYGLDTDQRGQGTLEDVDIFLQQTGLTRDELNTLLFLDLSNDEILAGLSRLFFINNTGDGTGYLWIEPNIQHELFHITVTSNDITDLNHRTLPNSVKAEFTNKNILLLNSDPELYILVDEPDQTWRLWDAKPDITYTLHQENGTLRVYDRTFDRLVNLTPLKLDRIYRFLKLSRKLGWTFADLDWGIRTLQGTETSEKVLRFDGVNDFVLIPQADDLTPQQLTIEAWVLPAKSGVNPIIAKGNSVKSFTQFALWMTPEGKLAFFNYIGEPTNSDLIHESGNYPFINGLALAEDENALNLIGERRLPLGVFSHVAVTINERDESQTYYQLKFYINGVLDSTWSLDRAILVSQNPNQIEGMEIRLGKDFNDSYLCGQLTDIRLWDTILSQSAIATHRFHRCHGREANLIAYWSLAESPDLQVRDTAVVDHPHPGILGGDSHHSIPIWVKGDLALDPLVRPISSYGYQFNGRDTYVGGRVDHLALNSLTLEAWVLISNAGHYPIVFKGDEQASQVEYGVWINENSKLVFSSSSLEQDVISTKKVALETKTHVAVTVNSTEVILYINGEATGRLETPINTLATTGSLLYIGRDFSGNYFQGTLQEIRLWNRDRTLDQLSTAMHDQLQGTEVGLLGYWRLDEPNPQDVKTRDRTFNQNHLSPGGILATYYPQLVTREEVLLPDPVEQTANVLHFAPNLSPVKLNNRKRQGLGYGEQFSLQFWFNPDHPNTSTPQLLFSQGDREVGLSVYLLAETLTVYAWCAAFGGDPLESEIVLEHPISTANQWYHFTLTYDETAQTGIEYRYYVNGDRVGEQTQGFRLDPIGNSCLGGLPTDQVTRFSGEVAEGNYGFSGLITDLRIWQIAITDEEIRNPVTRYHHRHIPPNSDQELLCYCPLTEDYGRSVSNHAGPKYLSQSDRGPEIPDQTPNRLHGELYVGADDITTKWQDGGELTVFPDTVLNLAESQVVRLPNSTELNLVNHSFTLELWLRVSHFVADLPILVSDTAILELTETGEVRLTLAEEELLSATPLTNQWHHLTWRYDQTTHTHTLFIDRILVGVLFNTGGISATIPLTLSEVEGLTLGESGVEIAELRVWSTPRTDEELQQTWNQKLVDTTNLTAHWIFDRDPRTHLLDRTINGYSATIETDEDIHSKWVETDATPAWTRQSQALVINQNPGVTPDFIELSTYPITETGTIELWVQFESTENAVLLDASTENYPFRLELVEGLIQFKLADTSGTETRVTLPLPDTDSFHHLAIAWQFDSPEAMTQIRLYVNEVELQSQSTGNGIKPDFAIPYLGLNQGDNLELVQPFKGAIAQFRGWNDLRSHQAVQKFPEADLTGTEAGLVTYLPFDEATGTAIQDRVSGTTLNLQALSVLHPDPQWTIVDRAIHFDGIDDGIEVNAYTPGETGTIELWVKFSPTRNQVLFDASVEESGKYFILDVAVQKLRFRLEDRRDFDFIAELDLSQVPLSEFTGQWHHIVAVWDYDADERRVNALLYLDDRQPAPSFQDFSVRPAGGNPHLQGETPEFDTLYFGKNRSNYAFVQTNPLKGDIRQFRIWERMLTTEEIQQLYQVPGDSITSGLVVDIPLDEGSGSRLRNLVGEDVATLQVGWRDHPQQKWFIVDQALELVGAETFIDTLTVPPTTGTLELWTQFSPTGSKILIDASSETTLFRLDVANGQLGFYLGSEDGVQLDLTSVPDSFAAQWHHIAVTWQWESQTQTVTTQLYLNDGSHATHQTSLSKLTLDSLYLGLSRLQAATLADYRAFDGKISQLRLWNQVRSLSELQRFRYGTLTGTEAGLFLYLPLDEGQGNQLRNQAGGNPASLKLGVFAEPNWIQRQLTLFNFEADTVVLPYASTLGLVNGDFTIEAWINLAEAIGYHPILSSLPTKLNPTSAVWTLTAIAGQLRLTVEEQELLTTDLSLTANTWHHVVCRYHQGTYSLSVDGQTSQDTLEADPIAIHRTLYLGMSRQWDASENTWNQTAFPGFIDEIRFWNTVRSDSELAQNRDRRLRGDEENLTAYWIFSDGQNRTLFDAQNYKRAYLSSDVGENSFHSARPPIYTPRQSPILDGYNDYISLGNTTVDLTQPYTVEFWFADQPNQWHHLAVVYEMNGAIAQVFHDGELQDQPETELTDKLTAFVANAAETEHPDRVTSGQVAEFRLWKGIRTAQEIQTNRDRYLTGREPNLCGYWRLDEGVGNQLEDTTEQLPPATLVIGLENTAEKWHLSLPPITGSVSTLYFDGKDDRVILSDVANLHLSGDFTVEAWVKLGNTMAESMPILGTGGLGLNLGIVAGKPTFSLNSDNTFTSDRTLDNEWHHITWQYDATTATGRILIDGEQVAQQENLPPFTAEGEASIGYAQDWDTVNSIMRDRYFHGWISEVRIWRTVRTPEMIRQQGNRPLLVTPEILANLTAYWIFDDRVDTIILSQIHPEDNPYYLNWTSDLDQEQPLWETLNTHPVLLNPLSQNALSFDGERQYLATADFAFPKGDFTIEAWIRVDSLTEVRSLLWWGDIPAMGAISPEFEWRISTTGILEFVMSGTVVAEAEDRIGLNTFTHVAVTLSENELTLYLNSKPQADKILSIAIQRRELTLEIGRGFSGILQEVRVWEIAKTGEQLRETAYHPVNPSEEHLVAVWSLATVETINSRLVTPNSVNPIPLELGGLPHSRKPTPGEATEFLDARRLVLTLPVSESAIADISLPTLKPQTYPDRAQRLIEVWFYCDNPTLSTRQIIYAEGDSHGGLSIYIENGILYFTGVSREGGWQGSVIKTERIQPRHWHHTALVLDGRVELRDDAFCALLDGRVIDKQPGSQLWGHLTQLNIGGLQITPSSNNNKVKAIASPLNGQIAEVRIWETPRSQADIRQDLYHLADINRPELLFYWNTSTGLPLGVVTPMSLPELMESGSSNPTIPFVELAMLYSLHRDFDLPINRLCALWSNLNHTGRGDGQTVYDDIFNPTTTSIPWSYPQRLTWEIQSTAADQRDIRTRLMSTLRVSSQEDLLRMVTAISGENTGIVTIDGNYLTLLYRIKLLSSLLGLSIAEMIRLLDILKRETATTQSPLNSINEFTIQDVLTIKQRADWMQETGIDLSEYEFLVYNRQDHRVSKPFSDTDSIDSSITLLDQSRGFFLTPSSFIAEDITEAASAAIYNSLKQRGAIDELTLYMPSADGNTGENITVSVVLASFSRFTKDDLSLVTSELNWQSTFDGLAIDAATLENAELIDTQGMVITDNPLEYSVEKLRAIAPDPNIDPAKLAAIRDLLERRRQSQTTLPTTITTQLQTLRQGLKDTISLTLADLLETDRDRLSLLLNLTTGNTYDRGTIDVVSLLKETSAIAQNQTVPVDSAFTNDLERLNKTLFLLQQFDLSEDEIALLLSQPELFGLSAESLVTPSYSDLDNLHTFVELKTQLNDPGNQLAKGLQDKTAILTLTGWTPLDIETLSQQLAIAQDYNTIPALDKLSQAFQWVQTLGADINTLIDLADTRDLSFSFYQRHAKALFDLVRAKYDANQWETVYKPIHDGLAIQKRDSLTAVALEQLSPQLISHKTPDILYEYLLIDVQMGSEVKTSRIVQATASLQLYVQRCLMNLELGVNPEQIPTQEWDWMKNYRVWEANCKVFLYPENYIEPELRDTKTELFQDLEDELQQSEATQDNVTQAYTRYLDKFADVTNLTIVGSYLDTDTIPKDYALKFNGTNTFILDPTLSNISTKITKDFTIEMWVKPDSQISSDRGLISAFNWESATREQKGWMLHVDGSNFQVYLSTQDALRSRIRYEYDRIPFEVTPGFTITRIITRTITEETGLMSSVSASYTPNHWYHIAATYNGSELKLYINGELKDSTPRTGDIFYPAIDDNQIPFVLGGKKDRDSDKKFIGEMRDVQIWNTARTPAQIKNSMVFGIANPANEPNLLYYWAMNEGQGDTVTDLKKTKDLQLNEGITWTSAPNRNLTPVDPVGITPTLYLIGRNDNTQEYYLRDWVNRHQWHPWQKIDLTINAEYVSPIFAFNKLFLFWAEIPDSVRAEDRKWVKNNNSGKPVDQNGNEIVLKSAQSLKQTLSDSTEITTNNATIDGTNGGSLSAKFVYSDKHDVIEQVNVTIKTPVIKYSYYNFSKTWVQPQTLPVSALETVELEDWQQHQPKWQRVYAQRWRESDVASPVQKSPQPLTRLDVAQLEPDSHLEQTIPSFSMTQLSLSFWLRVKNLTIETTSISEIPSHTFTLFRYDGDTPLQAKLTHTPSAIGEKPQIMEAVKASKTAFEQINITLNDIQRFRNGTLVSLESTKTQLTNQRNSTDNAAIAISDDAENAKQLAIATGTTLDNTALAIDYAEIAADASATDTDIADLASSLVEVVNQAITAAEFALLIANSASIETALNNAKTHRDTVQQEASDAQTEAGVEEPDTPTINAHTDAALTTSINALTELFTVLNAAQSEEATVPKYERGDLKLILQVGATEQTILSSVNYDTWQHIVFVLAHQSNQYQVTSYIYAGYDASVSGEYVVQGSQTTFDTQPLASGNLLHIGDVDNPEITPQDKEYEGQYQPLLSEFRLWNYQRQESDIAAERFQRNYGGEFGLELHLPLDSQSQLTRVQDNQLKLEQVFAPSVPESTRERIVLIYGDVIQTLRNNLKDIGYEYKLIKNADAGNSYSLSLAEPQSGAIVGIEDRAKIAIEDYAANQLSPLDRFRPQDRITILNQNTQELRRAIRQWQNNASDTVLLNNRDGGVQLNITESYILDVHNQPGWFILDIGDEIFLVQTAIENWRLQTAEERLRSNSTANTGGGGTQKQFDLYFDRDFALEVGNGSQIQFKFTRLNTFAVQTLSERLFGDGIDGLLSLASQNTEEPDFSNLATIDTRRIIAPKYYPDGTLDNRIDFKGAYGLYYEEIFFHIPFLIANQLNANQKFAEAQHWYHYIFNPTAQDSNSNGSAKDRYWRYRPFRNLSLETLSEILTDETALNAYRSDPFDPHAIARLRINTYQKAVVMKYIDNLIDWGDYLFRQDTRESINEATQLYVLAFALLGPTPQSKSTRQLEDIGTYTDVKADLERNQIDTIPDFLIETGNEVEPAPAIPFNPHRSVITRFCVPENSQFLGYWDVVSDRLYKIRHSLNIDGVFRSLSLFQPPINPAALVQAAASGLGGGIGSALAATNVSVPHYRYSFMLEKAKEMVGYVIDFGGALLEALENKGAEELILLQHTHELDILERTTEVKKLQQEELNANLTALEKSLASANERYRYYDQEVRGSGDFGANNFETIQSDLTLSANVIQSAAAISKFIAGLSGGTVDVEVGGSGFGGSPVATVKSGGSFIATLFDKGGDVMEITAGILDRTAGIMGTKAERKRREQEWNHNRTLAQYDIEEINQQIEATVAQINAASRDLLIHQRTIEQNKEVGNFYRTKFLNKDLYNWMANRLSALYFQTYQLAFDVAKQAERAFQFEFGTDESYISFGYWDSRRKGLLAGEALRLDLARLEKSALDQDSRYLEITKTISLARLDPIAFLQLRETGRCQFTLGELLFDRDFPGHYFRIIKSVSLSIPAVVGPYETVHATLTQTGHKTLMSPDITGVQYLLGEEPNIPSSIRADWRANQQIAVSTGVEDSGVFELNFNDDRYLPFEGTGAVSTWLLELPKQTNRFDFDSITDVVIHLRYMCKIDSGSFKQSVMGLEAFKHYRGVRLFSLAHEFATDWYTFKNQSNVRSLTLSLPKTTIPANIKPTEISVQQIYNLANGVLTEVGDQFTVKTSDVNASPITMELTAKGSFKKDKSETLLVLLAYS